MSSVPRLPPGDRALHEPDASAAVPRWSWPLAVGVAAASAGASAWYAWRELASGALGFPLDDGWIHAQFASHLAAGHGLVFNLGEPSAGSTSPLWTVLVALSVAAGADVVVGAKILGCACVAATAIAGARLTHVVSGSVPAAWLAGLSVALSARMTWASVSGMEVGLASALLLLALLAFVSGRHPASWGALAGLAGVARPELFPLIGVLAVFHLRQGSPRSRLVGWRGVILALGAFAVVFGLYAAVNWSHGGTIFPTTFSAKSKPQGLGYALSSLDGAELVRSLTVRVVENTSLLLRFFFEQSQVLFATFLVGCLALAGALRQQRVVRGAAVIVVFLALEAALLGAMAADVPLYAQEGRYVLPLLALFFCVGALGLDALRPITTNGWIVPAIALVALARLASQDVRFAGRYVDQVNNINALHVEMGRWAATHTAPGAMLAANDIGALGYFSGRTILDLEGLITPGILPFKAGKRHMAYLEQQRPDLLIIFPEWYPHLVKGASVFREVHRRSVPRVTAAHDALVVYDTPWTRAQTRDVLGAPHRNGTTP